MKERGYACYARLASYSVSISKLPKRRKFLNDEHTNNNFYCAYLLGKKTLVMIMRTRKEGCMLLSSFSGLFKCMRALASQVTVCVRIRLKEFRLFDVQSTRCIANE